LGRGNQLPISDEAWLVKISGEINRSAGLVSAGLRMRLAKDCSTNTTRRALLGLDG